MAKPRPKANLRGLFANDWATEDKVTFLAETFTIFSSLQRIAQEQNEQRQQAQRQSAGSLNNHALALTQALIPSAQTMQYYHRIVNLYREALKRYGKTLESSENEEDSADLELTQNLGAILHFVETLYIPADGRGTGVVGEEILHWLNSFDFAPRTEDGQSIAQSAVPYEHPAYWDYVLRCVLRGFNSSASSLLSSLASSHPSSTLRRITQQVCQLLSGMPRSTSFSLEHDFIAAHRRWFGQLRSLLNKLEHEMDEMEVELEREGEGRKSHEDIEDERLEFEAQFRCLLELMMGVKERVFEACEDWREALGAWGVLVQPSLKRDDVPQIVQTILDTFPIDATLSSDDVLCALAQGDVKRACQRARDCDPWLAAHMTDLLDRAGILEGDDEPESSQPETTSGFGKLANLSAVPLRIQLIQEYAETVLDDQGLWRLAVDYLSYCGAPGRRRMRYIVLDVPMNVASSSFLLSSAKRAEALQEAALDEEMDEQLDDPEDAAERRRLRKEQDLEAKRVSNESKTAIEVIETCVELGMQDEARAVCKRMSGEMVKQKRMGPALAYSVRAHDVRQIRRIVDVILQDYIDNGLDDLEKAVDSIPLTLLNAAAVSEAVLNLPKRAGEAERTGDDPMTDEGDQYDPLAAMPDQTISTSVSDRLVFLARYRDFHRHCALGELRQAATLLVEILSSGTAPEPFWAVLLVDSIPLLQSEESLFSKEESCELLRVLDHVIWSSLRHPSQARYYLGMLERFLSPVHAPSSSGIAHQSSDRLFDEDDESGEEETETQRSPKAADFDARIAVRRLDILRLALTRHLARCAMEA